MKKHLILLSVMAMLQLAVSNEVLAQNNSTKKDTTSTKAPKPQKRIFEVFDEEPKFKGGDEATFIRENLRYPQVALDNGIEGTVVVALIIEKDGTVSDIHVLSKVSGGCTEETIRVIKLMEGKWEPGKVNGTPVSGRKIFGIKFSIPKDMPKPKN